MHFANLWTMYPNITVHLRHGLCRQHGSIPCSSSDRVCFVFFFSEFSSNIYCVWMWRDGDIGRVSHPAMKQTLASIWKYQLEMIFAFGSCFPRLVSGRFVVIFRIGLNWFGNFDHMCGSDPIDRFGCCPFVIVWLFDVSLGDVSSSLTVGKEEETQRRSG